MLYRLLVVIGAVVIALAGAGCGPTISDFPKQEFVVQKEPVVHLAARGSRKGRKLVCQIFLLTASESMWVSAVDLRLSDGTYLDPKEIESLDDIDQERYPDMWVGFGAGYGRGYAYYGDYPYYRGYWRRGPYSYYRTGGGVCVPAWYLLGRRRGPHTPAGLEYTYELPDSQETCDGMRLTVHVAQEQAKEGKAKDAEAKTPDVKDEAEAVALREKKISFAFSFTTEDRVHTSESKKADEGPAKILYEIRFAPIAQETPK
ncbi:MAG: hypothetical protein AB1696_09675 [Planctomycetota bacterium]